MANDTGNKAAPAPRRPSLTGSGFEKRGGYPSQGAPIAKLPKVPAGPAPGAKPATGGSANGAGPQQASGS